MVTEIVGYAAATFGTALMLPQLLKMIKTKRVNDLSVWMLYVYLINCLLWGIYGFLLASKPMIACNLIATCIAIIQLLLKYKYSKVTI